VSPRRAARPAPEPDEPATEPEAASASDEAAQEPDEPAAEAEEPATDSRDETTAPPASEPDEEVAPSAEATEARVEPEADDVQVIDLIRDELALARAQIDAGLLGLAEGTVRRRLAHLEADGVGAGDETDALRLLLSETLWRQGRSTSARRALEAIRPASPQRRLPVAMLIEAETLAAAGEADRAAGAQERLLAAIGPDAAFELAGGVAGRITWPLPEAMQPGSGRVPRPPWTARPDGPDETEPPDDERIAAGRGRLEEARVAYVSGDLARGDAEMSIAVRLDPALAGDGVGLIEPTLGTQPPAERLLLYGDLLNAAGRDAEATRAYDLAADRRSGAAST
jgi:hypothetical protein